MLTIIVMETDNDHVHFLIHFILRLSIAQMVHRLKQESTRQFWHLHHAVLRKQYWYLHLCCSDGYFVCSIGEASPETISQYIFSPG